MTGTPHACIDCGGVEIKPMFVRSPRHADGMVRASGREVPGPDNYVIVQCGECGSVFLHPFHYAEAETLYNDERYNAGYFPDNVCEGGGPPLTGSPAPWYTRWRYRRKARKMLNLAGCAGMARPRVAEIGCAKGELLQGFVDCGCEACGIEVNRQLSAVAASKGLDVRTGFFEQQKFPDASFDLVVAVETFEHIANLPPILREVARTLKPAGKLVIQVPNDLQGYRSLVYRSWWWLIPPMHVRYFTKDTIARIVGSHGLRLLKLGTEGSVGGDACYFVGWFLRKAGCRNLPSSLLFNLFIKGMEILTLPLDAVLNMLRKHSEIIAVMNKDG